MLTSLDRITRNPEVLSGQPCVRGMRLTVRRVLELMAIYSEREELFAEFPELDSEDLRQCLEFAAASMDDQILEFQNAL